MSDNLAAFEAETRAIVQATLDEALQLLRGSILNAWGHLIDLSDPFVLSGRYRASWRVAVGAPVEDSGEPPGSYGRPSSAEAESVASRVRFGDVIYLSNNVGFGERHKSRSYAFFLEYGTSTISPHPVMEQASFAAEEALADAAFAFSNRRIG